MDTRTHPPTRIRRLESAGLKEVNALAFIAKSQIDDPNSVNGDLYSLNHFGVFEIHL